MTSQHPPGLALSQYVDSELPADRREEVSRHLGHCGECRETVDFYRRLSTAAGEPREVTVPDVADRVLRRRRDLRTSGDRTLAGGDAQNGARRRLAMVASVTAALLIGSYLILAPSATAHRSSLRFESSLPQPGDVVDVEYSPSTLLATRDSLRLRIRARKAETPFPRQGVIGELRTVTLYPNEAGRFESQVEVRPGDVYLAAAVEDFEGENVDTNLGRLWDVLVADSSGHPKMAALESKYRVLEPYNWVAASAWAAEAAEQYPDNPFGWTLLYVHQSRAGALPLSDSLSRFHRAKLSELAEDFERRSADELEWLALYAQLQGSQELRELVLEELAELDPANPSVVRWRIEEALRECGPEYTCRLARLDSVWVEISQPDESVAQFGLTTAALAGDLELMRRWTSRARQVPRISLSSLADKLDPFSGMTLERLELRRTRIEELESLDDSDRPLRLTVGEFRNAVRDTLRAERAKLGVDFATVGDTVEALSAFAEGSEYAWRPEILKPYVNLLLATGDTATAAPFVGLLLADPLVGEEIENTYRFLQFTGEQLPALEREYQRRVQSSVVRGRRIPADITVSLLNGETRRIGSLAGAATVFFLWEPDLPRADRLLQDFDEVDPGLWDAHGIQRIVLIHSPEPPDVDSGPPVVLDAEYELSQHLGAYRLLSYVVVNPELEVVAQTSDVTTAFRLASAISNQAQ